MRIPRNAYAVFLLVESYKVTKKRRLIPECEKVMRPFLKDIYFKFFHIFNENSKRTRIEFFREPLVQHLWNQYSHDCCNDFENFLKSMRAQPMGEQRLDRFFDDLNNVQTAANF